MLYEKFVELIPRQDTIYVCCHEISDMSIVKLTADNVRTFNLIVDGRDLLTYPQDQLCDNEKFRTIKCKLKNEA